MDIPIPEWSVMPLGDSASTAAVQVTLPHYVEGPRPTDTLEENTTDCHMIAEPGHRGPVAASTKADHLAEAGSPAAVPAASPTKLPAPVTTHPSAALTAYHLITLVKKVQHHIDIRYVISEYSSPTHTPAMKANSSPIEYLMDTPHSTGPST